MPVHIEGGRRWALPAADGASSLRRLWRTVGPGALTPDLAKPLMAAVTDALAANGPGSAILTWDDGPAVIGEARATLERWGPTHPGIDVAATAALALALRGDEIAATFLADALDRLAVGAGGPHHARFARAWRARSGNTANAASAGG
ncbi:MULTISPECIES: hypothetical protein [Methylobacterium]|uniref:Uncharacterized protein n=1 Tax=Methylobacterium jeotgali TaxID=381630 RepID=A0ABQ4SSS1_9HYPH|nr:MULTISPECIES: hypothetical protein [Methylobacterium]GBU15884.1 hypothetical protein AwMethylo_00990 [Methylobacterium sp.]GJE05341.1 hypothetical protein AOPFMNJM_0639 [Methylobacterium jeotgali]